MLSKEDVIEAHNKVKELFEAYISIASKKASLIVNKDIDLFKILDYDIEVDIPNFKVSVLLEDYEYEPDINEEIDIKQLDKVVNVDITIPEINQYFKEKYSFKHLIANNDLE